MSGLGQTNNPKDLVPGDPAEIAEVAGRLYNYGTLLTEAGNGLRRLDTSSGWQGEAGDAFRAKFKGQPAAWLEAGSCFTATARALDDYVPVLSRAQQDAAEAITQWAAGHKDAARSILASAQDQVSSAAGTATGIIGPARDKAPKKPGFWSHVGGVLEGAVHGAEEIGADVVNGVASFGNAMISNPGETAQLVAGLGIAELSTDAEAVGGLLDLTGIGTAPGLAINVAAAGGIALGGTMAMSAAGELAGHAAGDDHIDPVQVGDGGGGGEPSPDPRLTPGTPEYDEYTKELAKDPAHGGNSRPASEREATVAAQSEADGDMPGPIKRTPLKDGKDDGDFTDGTGQKWEVKSSPDVRPSYRPGAGKPIPAQSDEKFTSMINSELGKGQKVLLDPDGMTPARLAHLQEVVANNPQWQGQVVWGR